MTNKTPTPPATPHPWDAEDEYPPLDAEEAKAVGKAVTQATQNDPVSTIAQAIVGAVTGKTQDEAPTGSAPDAND